MYSQNSEITIFSTIYQPSFSGKILLLEDVGTTFRQLDRSLHQLLFMEESQKNKIKAIVFGQFYPLDPTDPERLIYKTVIEKFAEQFERPVYYFPYIGHGRKNHPLILGAETSISCKQNSEYNVMRYFSYTFVLIEASLLSKDDNTTNRQAPRAQARCSWGLSQG